MADSGQRPPDIPSFALDLQAAQGGAGRDVSAYVTLLAAALLTEATPGERVFLIVSPFAPVPPGIRQAAAGSAAEVTWMPLALPSPASASEDLVVSAAYDALPLAGTDYVGLAPLDCLPAGGTCSPVSMPRWARRMVLLVHDLAPALLPDTWFEDFSDVERRYRKRLQLVAEADIVCTATAYLAAQVPYGAGRTRAAAHPIGLAPPTLNSGPRPPDDDGRRKRVVYAYDPAPQRRPEMLVEAAARLPGCLRADLELLFLTDPNEKRRLDAVASDCGLAPGVIQVAPSTPEGVTSALRGAAAYAVPSCCEGYDLTALAAPLLGAPALVSEAVGGADLFGAGAAVFDPAVPASLARLLEPLLVDGTHRDRLLARQLEALAPLSWAGVAKGLRDSMGRRPAAPLAPQQAPASLREDPRRRPGRRRPRPRRPAMTGPLPPVPSGISKYIEDQTRAAVGTVDVDWIRSPESPGPDGDHPWVLDPGEVPSTALWWHHLANQRRYHFRQFELMATHGGVVEVHDADLPFVVPPVLVPPPGVRVPDDLREELAAVYRRGPTLSPETGEAGTGVLLRWLARHTDALVVHSPQAREMLRRHVPDENVPVHVVPHGAWMSAEVRLVALSGRARTPERPYIIVPGFVGPAKWPEGIIASVARIPRSHRPLLVFGGLSPPHLDVKLHHEAARRDVEITITGYLSSADFDTWLARAAAAVIGRLVVRGESSGTVPRATRVGTPTLVVARRAFSELPRSVPLLSASDLSPSAVGDRLAAMVDSPLAEPTSPDRKELFAASLPSLRDMFSWEPTVELMTLLASPPAPTNRPTAPASADQVAQELGS